MRPSEEKYPAHQWIASAPGKLVLLGEYAVLTGQPSVVMAVDRRVRITFTRHADKHSISVLSAPQLGIVDQHFYLQSDPPQVQFSPPLRDAAMEDQLALFRTVVASAASWQIPLPPMSIHIDSSACVLSSSDVMESSEPQSVPAPTGPKLGVGASAAVATALMAGLEHIAHASSAVVASSPAALHARVWQAHRSAQQGGSGIDIAASVYGGVLRYQWATQQRGRGEGITAQVQSLPWPISNDVVLLGVWAGHATSTPHMVQQVTAWGRMQPALYDQLMHTLGDAAESGATALRTGDCPALCDAITRTFQALQHLSQVSGVPIVSETHARVGELVYALGAVYKPSGAGGGDLGIAVCPSPQVAQQVVAALTQSGWQTFALACAQHGVQVEQVTNPSLSSSSSSFRPT